MISCCGCQPYGGTLRVDCLDQVVPTSIHPVNRFLVKHRGSETNCWRARYRCGRRWLLKRVARHAVFDALYAIASI